MDQLVHQLLGSLKASPPRLTLDQREMALSKKQAELHAETRATLRENVVVVYALATWPPADVAS